MKAALWLVMLAACTNHGGSLTDDGAGVDPDSFPFATPVGQWTWVDVHGMECGNGVATGIGVNRSDTSDDVLVFRPTSTTSRSCAPTRRIRSARRRTSTCRTARAICMPARM